MWEAIIDTIVEEFTDLHDLAEFTRVALRLIVAALLGAVIGFERERRVQSAGLRTHMLVAMGAALFIVSCEQSGMDREALSRVLQGLISGVGFLGAGAVLKLSDHGEVRGLTTAAGIWATAAIGVTVGLGREFTAVLATLMVLGILAVLLPLERRWFPQRRPEDDTKDG